MAEMSPQAQAVLDAFLGDCADTGLQMDDLRENVAAALRAAADQVVPEERKECEHFTNEAIRLNRMGVRAELVAIAAELEAQ